jgi:hypothetical protein
LILVLLKFDAGLLLEFFSSSTTCRPSLVSFSALRVTNLTIPHLSKAAINITYLADQGMDPSYSSFVKALATEIPGLTPLAKLVAELSQPDTKNTTIRCLEFRKQGLVPFEATNLELLSAKIQEFKSDVKLGDAGLCVLIEDINPSYIDMLGALLDIDPRFFSAHPLLLSAL